MNENSTNGNRNGVTLSKGTVFPDGKSTESMPLIEGPTAVQHVFDGMLVIRTDHSPERVILGRGTEVILDMTDDERTAGLLSEEGRSGFLMAIEKAQAQFHEMPPYLFSGEHTHDFGFIIYTIEGRWVLCSDGDRCLMHPGSICAIRAGSSSGMEVPFGEGARAIYFLEGGVEVQRKYEEYMKKVASGMIKRHVGSMTSLRDLPESHPAIIFARRVNPCLQNDR